MSESPNTASFYKVGGALPQDVPSYVRRKSDDDLYKALKAGEFCYVLNSRQMGKTSLMVRTLAKLQADGWAGIIIDFSAKDSQVDRPDRWYGGIINQLNRQFGLLERSAFRNWLKERDFIAPVERLAEFIETVLLPSSESPIVIFIDEIDSTLGLPFTDDFFALIRACYNKRAENPDYRRLTFALLGVAAPSELIGDAKRTPFNIGQSIDLKGFEFKEALPLAAGLSDQAERPEEVLREILHWTGGQPFLTQRLCQLVADSDSAISSGEEAAQVQQLVNSRLIEHWESQDHQEHLKTICKRLLDDEQKAGYLLELYRQILQAGELSANNRPEERELQLSGLVVKRDNQLRVYNPIYAAVFNEAWINTELQKLRPYSESFRAWVASGKTDSSRLLRGGALIEAEQWAGAKTTLSAEDREFLAASRTRQREEEIAVKEQESELARERTAREAAEAAEQVQAEANWQAQQKIRRGGLVLGVALIAAALLGVLTIVSGEELRGARQEADKALQELEQARKELQEMDEQREEVIKGLKESQRELQLVEGDREKAKAQLVVAENQVNQAERKLEDAQKSQQEAEVSARNAQVTAEKAIKAKEEAQSLVKQAQAELSNAEQNLSAATQELAILNQQQDEIAEAIATVNEISSLINSLYEYEKSGEATDSIEQLGLSFTDFTENKAEFKEAFLKSSIALANLHLGKEDEASVVIHESIQLIDENQPLFTSSLRGRTIAFFSYAVLGNLYEEQQPTVFPKGIYDKAFSYVNNERHDITEDNILEYYHELIYSLLGYQDWYPWRILAKASLKKHYAFRAKKMIREIEVFLTQREWRKADLLTWESIAFLSLSRNPYEISFNNISCSDLKEINDLWANHSQVNGQSRFGFQVQQKIYQEGLEDVEKISDDSDGRQKIANFTRLYYEVGWLHLSEEPTELYTLKKYEELDWDVSSNLIDKNAGYLPVIPWLYGRAYWDSGQHRLRVFTGDYESSKFDYYVRGSYNSVEMDRLFPENRPLLGRGDSANTVGNSYLLFYPINLGLDRVRGLIEGGIHTTYINGFFYRGDHSLPFSVSIDPSQIFDCNYGAPEGAESSTIY
ncbi:hypothetical protein C8255_13795 [filamentous cyanobacterium CCP3]|nr:hypothetical protein C8255_13795 [filamentous cyanobacterium CCP3]